MIILFFVAKPLLYALVFMVGARWFFRAYGPHWRWPEWATVALATLGRYGAGFAALFAVDWCSRRLGHVSGPLDSQHYLGMVLACGLVLWWAAARLAFRRAPAVRLWMFALLAELMSGAIDYYAWREVQHINMC
jgi:hypothetical protein